jgi:hypothetical protein
VEQDEEQILAEVSKEAVDPFEVEKMSEKFDEAEFEEKQNEIEETPGWVYMDKQALLVKGTAGHRNRPGRSGLDPLDTRFDEARVEGGLIRRLFTGHLRTHDPIYLVLMSILGIVFSLPAIFIIGSMGNISGAELTLLCPMSLIVFCGLALIVNVIMSILSEKPEEISKNGGKFF